MYQHLISISKFTPCPEYISLQVRALVLMPPGILTNRVVFASISSPLSHPGLPENVPITCFEGGAALSSDHDVIAVTSMMSRLEPQLDILGKWLEKDPALEKPGSDHHHSVHNIL